jgi:TetR/AcrR family tetracycline transcriptional repressor
VKDNKRPGLTRPLVIETALRLLDDVGLDGLTVRRLAAELGVKSPALYWHFRNKEELLDGMADAITWAAGMGPPREDESWQDYLLRRTRAYRQSVLSHRDGARLVSNARLGARTIRMFDTELTALVEGGFTPLLALHTITALAHYVIGFVLQEQAARREDEARPEDQMAALADLLDAGASATLLVAIREGGNPVGDQAFEHGLHVLIDGTVAALAREQSSQITSRRR